MKVYTSSLRFTTGHIVSFCSACYVTFSLNRDPDENGVSGNTYTSTVGGGYVSHVPHSNIFRE